MQNTPRAAGSRRTNTFLLRNCKLDRLKSSRWNRAPRAARAPRLLSQTNINQLFLLGQLALLHYLNTVNYSSFVHATENIIDRRAGLLRSMLRLANLYTVDNNLREGFDLDNFLSLSKSRYINNIIYI